MERTKHKKVGPEKREKIQEKHFCDFITETRLDNWKIKRPAEAWPKRMKISDPNYTEY
jgi:hypothetical protein